MPPPPELPTRHLTPRRRPCRSHQSVPFAVIAAAVIAAAKLIGFQSILPTAWVVEPVGTCYGLDGLQVRHRDAGPSGLLSDDTGTYG